MFGSAEAAQGGGLRLPGGPTLLETIVETSNGDSLREMTLIVRSDDALRLGFDISTSCMRLAIALWVPMSVVSNVEGGDIADCLEGM